MIIELRPLLLLRRLALKDTADVWPNYNYFKQQACDFALDKENMSENSIIYMNQGYQSWKDNKKIYYVNYYILGQVNESLNPPENLEIHEFKYREVKLYCPQFDNVTGNFEGLYETLGYIMAHGDMGEHFLDSKQNSKILHSFTRNVCQTVFQVYSLINIKYSMSLVHCRLIFQKYITSYRVSLTK